MSGLPFAPPISFARPFQSAGASLSCAAEASIDPDKTFHQNVKNKKQLESSKGTVEEPRAETPVEEY